EREHPALGAARAVHARLDALARRGRGPARRHGEIELERGALRRLVEAREPAAIGLRLAVRERQRRTRAVRTVAGEPQPALGLSVVAHVEHGLVPGGERLGELERELAALAPERERAAALVRGSLDRQTDEVELHLAQRVLEGREAHATRAADRARLRQELE